MVSAYAQQLRLLSFDIVEQITRLPADWLLHVAAAALLWLGASLTVWAQLQLRIP